MSNQQLIIQNNDEENENKSFKQEYNIKFDFLCKLLEKIAKLKPKDKSKYYYQYIIFIDLY